MTDDSTDMELNNACQLGGVEVTSGNPAGQLAVPDAVVS